MTAVNGGDGERSAVEDARAALDAAPRVVRQASDGIARRDACQRALDCIQDSHVGASQLGPPLARVLREAIATDDRSRALETFVSSATETACQRLATRALKRLSLRRLVREFGPESNTVRTIIRVLASTASRRTTLPDARENAFEALGRLACAAPDAVAAELDDPAVTDAAIRAVTGDRDTNHSERLGPFRILALLAHRGQLEPETTDGLERAVRRACSAGFAERSALAHVIANTPVGESSWVTANRSVGPPEHDALDPGRQVGPQLVQQALEGDRGAAQTLRRLVALGVVRPPSDAIPSRNPHVVHDAIDDGEDVHDLVILANLGAAALLDTPVEDVSAATAIGRLFALAIDRDVAVPLRDYAVFAANDLVPIDDSETTRTALRDLLAKPEMIYPTVKGRALGGLLIAPNPTARPERTSMDAAVGERDHSVDADGLPGRVEVLSGEASGPYLQAVGLLASTPLLDVDPVRFVAAVTSQVGEVPLPYELERAIEYSASLGVLDSVAPNAAELLVERLADAAPFTDDGLERRITTITLLGQVAETTDVEHAIGPTISALQTVIRWSTEPFESVEAAVSLGAFAQAGHVPDGYSLVEFPVGTLIERYRNGWDLEILVVLRQLLEAGLVDTLPAAFVTDLVDTLTSPDDVDDSVLDVLEALAAIDELDPSALRPVLPTPLQSQSVTNGDDEWSLPFDAYHAEQFFRTLRKAFEHTGVERQFDVTVTAGLASHDLSAAAKVELTMLGLQSPEEPARRRTLD